MPWRWVLGALLVGCGARSGLDVQPPDGGPDGQVRGCLRDWECDDGVECTLDRCVVGRCTQEPRHALCEDDVFCNGPARCTARGCASEPVRCDDRVACTVDRCDEELAACVHEPDVDLCPISHRCDPVRGCVARALAHDPRRLWEIDLPSGEARGLVPTELPLTDLALHPDGRLFGLSARGGLFEIDEETGRMYRVVDLEAGLNALEVGPDGALYGAGTRTIVRIDPEHGAFETVAGFPPGWSASGDVAFVAGRLLVTGTRAPYSRTVSDALFDATEGGVAVNVGTIGAACVWGLAPFGETLYGLTCTGALVRIDVSSGAGTRLADDLGLEVGGAAAR